MPGGSASSRTEGRHGATAADTAPGTGAHPEDAEPGERIVELDRVLRTHEAQGGGDLLRHPPVRRLPPREPESAPQSRHVGVEGNDEVPRRHRAPQSEIDTVRATDDPPQEQVVPLARRPAFRAREEEVALARQVLPPPVAEPAEESRQVPPKVGGVPPPSRDVEPLERSVREVRRADTAEETVHPFGRDEPVGKTGDRTSAGRLHGGQGGVRRRGKGVEEARQEVPDLEDASEGERRGEKRGGLGVPGVGVPVGKRDRVGGKLRSAALL